MLGHITAALPWLLFAPLLLGLVTQNNPWWQDAYDGVKAASKRFSGIVGDAAHALRGGYHIAYLLQKWWSDYSTIASTDQGGDRSKASGLDISFNTGEMIVHTQRGFLAMRLGVKAFLSVREANGTLDGVRTSNYDRLRRGQNYKPDATHLWHMHFGGDRSTWTDARYAPAAALGFAAVMNGSLIAPRSEEDELSAATDLLAKVLTVATSAAALAAEAARDSKWVRDRITPTLPGPENGRGSYYVLDPGYVQVEKLVKPDGDMRFRAVVGGKLYRDAQLNRTLDLGDGFTFGQRLAALEARD